MSLEQQIEHHGRRGSAPVSALPHALGVVLVPRRRPFGRGGIADLLADVRHRRRLRRCSGSGS